MPISLSQRSKSIWTASGDYLGHFIEVEGRRDRTALALWVAAAEARDG
jgi:hypothetical protein